MLKKRIYALCCVVILSVPAAYAAPPALPTSIMNEIGSDYTHDTNMLKQKRRDFEVQNNYNIRESKPAAEVIQERTPVVPAIKAVIQEAETQGIYVNGIQVSPSEILTKEEITSIVSSLVGRNVFVDDIQRVIDQINNLYAQKGYVTARAFLPEQKVQNGNIYIELVESKIGDITVQNNRWTKTKYITDRIPEQEGQLFDIVELEKDILDFNRYNEGVRLTANLHAGRAPGTTDINFVANESFPFHLVGIMDNAGRYSTGSVRAGAMLYADSLFHVRDRLSLGSYFSGGAQSPFIDYNIPVNKGDGRIGFMYASTFAKLRYGGLQDLDVRSKSYQYSLYFSQPIKRTVDMELKSYTALNYKRARTESGLIFGGRDWFAGLDEVTSAETALLLRKDTKRGIWYVNQNLYYAVPLLDKDNNYFKYSGGITRLHDFSHGVIGQIRSNYQIIPGDKHIPYLDQIQSGGLATVRGYSEGIMIGKNGYFASAELMFPLLPREIRGKNDERIPFVGKYVKGALFWDNAGIFPAAREDVYGGSYFLMSLGFGLRVQLPGDLSGRIYWGYPLVNNAWEPDRKYGRIHFELTLAPDVDTLLKNRSTAKGVEEKVYAKPSAPSSAPSAPAAQSAPYAQERHYEDVRHYDYFRDGGTAL
ncbi:MAG: BamA/TamA family outer membrane protein [Heliobacteriaceae bacterium]|jgi:hemolysin activation/secretion protein|nr:BamA/TamA family outer membrane protein [Heliobacteriaceae bacterium]